MTTNTNDGIHERGTSLEEEFFRREDARLVAQLKERATTEAARAALSKATGIDDATILDRLLELKIRAETVTALGLAPLVEVAWADGELDAKERAAVLKQASEQGFAAGSIEHALLESWLGRKPEASLLVAWTSLVRGMCQKLGPDEVAKLKASIVGRARSVASASGGVLGVGKTSSAESQVLARIEKAFG